MRRPRDIEYYRIRETLDLVTNYDAPKIPENHFTDITGFRNSKRGVIAERDYGLIARFSGLPANFKPKTGTTLYDASNNQYYYVFAGVNSTNDKTEIYVYDNGNFSKITPTHPEWNDTNGATPYLKLFTIDARKKAILLYGTSANPPVIRIPVRIEKHASTRQRFGLSLGAGWYASRHQLTSIYEHIDSMPAKDEELSGDGVWDAPEYDYGVVQTADKTWDHVFENKGSLDVVINSFVVESPVHWDDEETPYFQITAGAGGVTVQPGTTHTVTVKANKVVSSGPLLPVTGDLMAVRADGAALKFLSGYFTSGSI